MPLTKVQQQIVNGIAEGKTLNQVRPPGVSRQMVHKWRQRDSDFKAAYAEARECQAEAWVEETFKIADNDRKDKTNRSAVNRAALRIDVRKWAAGKYAPALFGDKVALTGPSGGPIQIIKKTMTDEEAAAAYAATLEQG